MSGSWHCLFCRREYGIGLDRCPDCGKKSRQNFPIIDQETIALCQSKIACEIADAWRGVAGQEAFARRAPRLAGALDRLDEATRTSLLRKVVR